jgi:hypothetical protein
MKPNEVQTFSATDPAAIQLSIALARARDGRAKLADNKVIFTDNVRMGVLLGKDVGEYTWKTAKLLADNESLSAMVKAAGVASAPVPVAVAPVPAAVPTVVPTVATAVAVAVAGVPTQLTASFGEYLRMDAGSRTRFCELGGSLGAVSGTTFEAMSPKLKIEYMQAGGKIADGPAAPSRMAIGHPEKGQNNTDARAFSGNGNTKTTADFEAMNPADRMACMRSGGKLSD